MALLQLADCHEQTGNLEEAINHYKKATALNPGVAEIHSALGRLYLGIKDFNSAVTSFRSAIKLKPEYGDAYFGLGDALRLAGYFEDAIDYYEQALSNNGSANPAFIHSNIGTCRQYLGDIESAIASFKEAISLVPDRYELFTNLLMALNYSSHYTAEEAFQMHRSFDSNYARQYSDSALTLKNSNNPERVLKIGYISSNFYDHSVAYFIKPVIEHHDTSQYEVFCYNNSPQSDAVTEQIRSLSSKWRDVTALSDIDLSSMIHDDGIDILVDLNGHTADNRLLVFARKPAPIQVSWIGYPNTTGLSSMDYRLTDALADPPGSTDHLHSERLIRLPDTFSCFSPPTPCPEVTEPPVLIKGYVTFGSFNNFAKITPQVIEVWRKLINKYPDSHLLLKDQLFQDEKVRSKIKAYFQQAGIEQNRIELLTKDNSRTSHLQRYSQIDIALDPFPYNGTTTTCEALWMGVPVITLAGTVHAGRVGVSQMTAVGLAEFVAKTQEQYIDTAIEFASDRERLQFLRSTMRQRLSNSPLLNAFAFTKNLEAAYRKMWYKWCIGGLLA